MITPFCAADVRPQARLVVGFRLADVVSCRPAVGGGPEHHVHVLGVPCDGLRPPAPDAACVARQWQEFFGLDVWTAGAMAWKRDYAVVGGVTLSGWRWDPAQTVVGLCLAEATVDTPLVVCMPEASLLTDGLNLVCNRLRELSRRLTGDVHAVGSVQVRPHLLLYSSRLEDMR